MEINIIAAAIMISVAAWCAAMANSRLFSKYIEGITRQPEAQKTLFGQVMILFGLIEALPIIGVAFGILLIFGLV